ncbi:nitroreductase family protein [uncultured Kriegella sp.]|uniref:nitroreductase family protein n=1 Tax=uncultured Kriegella sp. TaxID=1798910 RepID=UPI0030D85EAB|tara:strand:+ start:95139 stop:95747 length:609 start_codon:yes stop_codon:yes gene_type:complete
MTEEEQIRLSNIADTQYEIFALLKQRYSPRTFKDESIQKEHLRQLFEAVRWSASCYNIQPWRFIYAERGSEAYDKIAECLSEGNKKWASFAPLLLLSVYKVKMEGGNENFHALHDLGLSLGNMTVQAQYLGIALHHMAGIDRKAADEVFDIPEGFQVCTAIALGYFGGELDKLPIDLQEKEKATRERMTQTDFAFENNWKLH